MEDKDYYNVVPCSSIAVESFIRVGASGAIFGLCFDPYNADKLGLRGVEKALFVARGAGRMGIRCGALAVLFSYTRCAVQHYRKKNDWVNGLIAGAVAGAAIASGTRSRTQVIGMAGLISAVCAAADYSRTK